MNNSFPLISLQQMVIFVTVVEENGFASAGRALHMSQSAVSKSIAKLEKELAVRLFERSTRYLNLTEAGRILYEDWKIHLSAWANTYQLALARHNENNKRLRIGLMNTARPERYFYPQIREFFKRFPDTACEIESQYMTDLVKELEQEHFDLILLPDFTRFYLEKRHLKWQYYVTDTARLIMSSHHPFAKRKSLTTKDLLDLKFVTVSTFTGDEEYLRDLTERLAPYGKVPEVAHIYKTAYDIRYLFRPDDAVLLVDAYFDYPAEEKDFVILPVTDQKNGVICAWDPKRKNAAIEQFLHILPDPEENRLIPIGNISCHYFRL